MRESDIQTIFSKKNEREGFFELKLAKRNMLPFKDVKTHQLEALSAISCGKGLFHKISDQPWGTTNKFRFTKPKPFDCFFLTHQQAYVVICWYIPREPKEFHYIPINLFLDEMETSLRKSLTRTRSEEIATMVMIA